MKTPKPNPTLYTRALVLLLGVVMVGTHLQATAAQGDVQTSIKIPVLGVNIAPGLIMSRPSVQGIEIQVIGSAEHMQTLQKASDNELSAQVKPLDLLQRFGGEQGRHQQRVR